MVITTWLYKEERDHFDQSIGIYTLTEKFCGKLVNGNKLHPSLMCSTSMY